MGYQPLSKNVAEDIVSWERLQFLSEDMACTFEDFQQRYYLQVVQNVKIKPHSTAIKIRQNFWKLKIASVMIEPAAAILLFSRREIFSKCCESELVYNQYV
jgi:hypothetical protein